MKKLAAIAMILAMTTATLAGCGATANDAAASVETTPAAEAAAEPAEEAAQDDVVYNVGICQLVQHDALDAATQGFMDALTDKLGENVVFDNQNASGDSATCATIINQFVSNEVDLILANATPALQAAAAGTNEIPILGTSITDYATALEIDDWTGTTGTNIFGTSDLAPLDEQAAMLNELFPDAKTVGLFTVPQKPTPHIRLAWCRQRWKISAILAQHTPLRTPTILLP